MKVKSIDAETGCSVDQHDLKYLRVTAFENFVESESTSEIGSECVGKQDVQPINNVNQYPVLHSFLSSKSEFLWEISESFIVG